VFGLQYEPRLESSIEHHAIEIDCIEVQAEQFSQATPHRLGWLASRLPILLRADSLSLGGPDPIDERRLAACASAVRHSAARWMVHPVGFSRAGEIDLGLTMPIAPTPANVDLVADRARHVVERCGVPLLFEPHASRLRLIGTLAETEFLGQLCARADTGLVVDVAVLWAAGRRHGFDPRSWLDDFDAERIAQFRIALPDEQRSDAGAATLEAQLSLVGHALAGARPKAFVVSAPSSVPLPEVAQALTRLAAVVSHALAAPRVMT
jgi:uncharacterized protein (UPF0276 family)